MGGFATGFLGQVGDTVKKKADEAHDANIAQKKAQSDIYWGVIKNPDSTPEQINYAHDQLGKLYPKDPQIKQLFDKFRGLIQQTHPGHQAAAAAQGDVPPKGEPDAPPAQGNGPIPAPPQPPGAAAAPTATGTIATPPFNPSAKSAIPPPPAPPGGNPRNMSPMQMDPRVPATKGDPRFAEMAHAAGSTQGAEDKKRAEWDRQEKVKHDYKMAELDEAAKAKSTNPTGRATAISPISMSEARKMAAAGQTFTAADGGDPLTLDDYDDTMMLVPLQQNGKIVGYSPASQRQTHLTYNNKVIAVPSLNQMDANVKGTELGQAQVGATTKTTDPATGQTTTAVRTPNAPAAAGGAVTTPAPKPSATPSATPPAKSAPIAKSAPSTGPSTPSASAPTQPTPRGLPPLDADGHIPAVAGTPQVVEGANQLLNSEKDVKDLPSKTKELSASMARKYGWDENAFTPQERRQIGIASSYVDEMLANPSLATLDSDFWSQLPMLGATADPNKEGIIGKAITKIAARGMTDDQAEFLRSYRQLASVISGLGKLTRGGRITEATVNRLLSDLPNPTNTKDSKDARARLVRLQNEVKKAMDNNSFEKITGKGRSQIPAPPKPGDVSTGQLSQAAKDYLKSQGVPVN